MNDLERHVEHLLAYMTLSKKSASMSSHQSKQRPPIGPGSGRKGRKDFDEMAHARMRQRAGLRLDLFDVSLEHFSGAEPFCFWDALGINANEEAPFFSSVKPADLNHALDVRIVRAVGQDGLIAEEGGDFGCCLFFDRVRKIKQKEIRGYSGVCAKFLVEVAAAAVDTSTGKYSSWRFFAGSSDGLSWYEVLPKGFARDEKLSVSVVMSHSIQFTRYYNWVVYIAHEDGPSISLPTDAEGAMQIIKSRDKPVGKSRRDALCHWVRDHFRRTRGESDDGLAYVREHLRGKQHFAWNGLRCLVVPSGHDLARVATRSPSEFATALSSQTRPAGASS